MPSLLLKDGPESGHTIAVESELLIGRVNAPLRSTIRSSLAAMPSCGRWEERSRSRISARSTAPGSTVSASRATTAEGGDVVGVGSTTMEIEVEPAEQFTVLAEVATPPRGPGAPPPVAPSPRPAPSPAVPEPAAAEPAVELLRRKRRSRHLLPHRLRRSRRRDLGQCGRRVRPVAALFADIVGSTSLGERLKPAEVKALIGDCVTRMTRAVEEFGGTVGAYMGDGIAAFYGVPSAHEDDPERARVRPAHPRGGRALRPRGRERMGNLGFQRPGRDQHGRGRGRPGGIRRSTSDLARRHEQRGRAPARRR